MKVSWIIGVEIMAAFDKFFRKSAEKVHGGVKDARAYIPTQHFSDVAAQDEAVESLRALVDVLRQPQKYARYGRPAPARRAALRARQGTGKTLLARALAGEAGVPFYSACGSDFVQMYVGVGAARVRDLFKKARQGWTCRCVHR